MIMEKSDVLKNALSFKFGGMSEEELSFLYDFCKGKKVLELGSMVGMSSYVIASTCKSLSCVDVWEDSFEHLKHSPRQKEVYEKDWIDGNMFDVFKNNCDNFIKSGKINIFRKNTEEAHNLFDNDFFDIIIFDADHEYDGVIKDIENYISKIKKDGNLLFHDYGCSMWHGVGEACSNYINKGKISILSVVDRLAVFELNNINNFEMN